MQAMIFVSSIVNVCTRLLAQRPGLVGVQYSPALSCFGPTQVAVLRIRRVATLRLRLQF